MGVEITPSVLASRLPQLRQRLKIAERFKPKRIHLDVMDGRFVTSRSVPVKKLQAARFNRPVEIHLMVRQPELWLPLILSHHIQRVVLHVELGTRLLHLIALFRSHRRQVYVAINPTTPVTKLQPWVSSIQGVVVMGVTPGKYHATFMPTTAARIRLLHRRYPRLVIACDGGLDLKTIPDVMKAGASQLIIGSYLMWSDDPDQAWRQAQALVRRPRK